jgi:multimeric flavodoxin WrbA
MDTLLPKLRTDLIVWATPLYYSTVPGIMKDFIDRMLPAVEPFLIERNDTTSHPLRNASHNLQTFLISVAGFPERSHFDALVATFRKFSPDLRGKLLIGWAEPMSQEALQGTFTELYELVEQAGYEVVANGTMSQETEQAIIAKTTYSQEQIAQLRSMANAYWKTQLDNPPEP